MTLARQKHTSTERAIAKQIGLSDAQLAALLQIRQGRWPGNAAAVLERRGFADRGACYGKGHLTEAGEALLSRARTLGY